ncbi:bifunctional folylpolyglutamate synthase/dihydrofolate synthase [Sphingopyxis macrogoltabida]|uniref:Dihydrofolate synthase/folylpolyglutamate synthase n=1 Tax=Sphingopyxis macrogoltabida TaxID=33050 RepID=A0AAC8Z0L3_SPHMC|nr:folylpolyglutamate synthase/dihydrofolate synthase family protein [Sphingopyxis macrogoltabida]ALJ12971.1 folylpolyglutamate synthase [Sphingopyxis macrogoltabida]AMU89562.1 bifunctional folylpolyglutamate synthase/dihydrofolate synthase [Sphingopyxis macrogoltabida]
MADHAHSSDPAVQAQLDRLAALSPGRDILGLERIAEICARLGNPQERLPRTFHVAGTNGKGSTCAFLRAILEAGGRRVHSYTSPHLVRFNERIRLAGTLIDDELLASLLEEVLDIAADLHASFFEVTTAAAFLAFARTPADDCIIEVGLGGRLDATNIIPAPAVCGIASLGIDHEAFLLAPEAGTPQEPATRIAWEKAGIIKPGTRVATLSYPPAVTDIIAARASAAGAPLFLEGSGWQVDPEGDGFRWSSASLGAVGEALFPRMAGPHQRRNAGLAIAMSRLAEPRPADADIVRGIAGTFWPGRMQLLGSGPLTAAMSGEQNIWIDGGHNLDAALQLADFLGQTLARREPVDLVLGMLANKDVAGFLALLAPHVGRLVAVPIPGHEHHAPADLVRIARDSGIVQASAQGDLPSALRALAADSPARNILIGGSLYLVGQALELNEEFPS